MGRKQIVLATSVLSRHTRSRSPDFPGRCLQVGFDRHQQLVRDRGYFGPRRFAGGCSACWPEVWRKRGAGHAPRRRRPTPQAVGQTRAGRKWTALISAILLGVKSWPPAVPPAWTELTDPLHGESSACTGWPLRCLSEASIPPSHCSSRKISTPNWRDRSCTGLARKPQVDLTDFCAPPSITMAKSQRACRQSLA